MDKKFVNKFVDIEGLHYLDQALKSGKGIILMTGHLGIPHLGFVVLRVLGYNVTVLKGGGAPRGSKHSKYKYYDTEDKTIFLHDPSPSKTYKKRILDTLQSGGTIHHSADAAEGKSTEEITCLGVKMKFPTGILYYAHQAEAVIVPFFPFYRRGKISIVFKEPIDNHWAQGKAEYNAILTKYAKILEYYILKYPEQYLGIYGPTVLSHYYRDHHKEPLPIKKK
jgi:lauroyl/myristoyl acyltransferase